MKTLLIVRHAKSSWADIGEADFDRSLNDRGKKDAPEMAERLRNKKIKIDAFVSSPAKRAKMTCEAFCKIYGVDKSAIVFVDKLYHAPAYVFFDVINEWAVTGNTVAMFAHNPGITDFAEKLYAEKAPGNMPTCAVFAVQADVKDWKEFEHADKKFLFFDFPKSTA